MGVGIVGFELAGRRVWWAWYVNVANQGVWLAFALITGYWGFVVGTIFYTYQFTRNAIKWTRERRTLNKPPDEYVRVGEVISARERWMKPVGIVVEGIGMYEQNAPKKGTTLYYKRGE
jgi:hypothetical protein